MPATLGQKYYKSAGWIRLVCNAHKGEESTRTIPLEGSGRLNCSYCDRQAIVVQIPENLKIVEI